MFNHLLSVVIQFITVLLRTILPKSPKPVFVRVRLDVSGLDYIVPNTPAAISSAQSAILDDLYQLVKYDDLPDSVEVLVAPNASWDDVPSWLADGEDTTSSVNPVEETDC